MLYTLLLLLCLYLPFQSALNISEGIDLATGRVLVLLIGLAWIVKSLAHKKLFIPNKIQTLLFLSFLFLSTFSLVMAQNQDWAYRKLLFLLSFVPLYFIVADYAQQKEPAKKIILWGVYGAGAISLVGIFQFLIQFFIGIDAEIALWQKIVSPFLGNTFSQAVFEYPSWLVGIGGKTYMRAIAFFPDPHMFSFYLGMTLPFSIALRMAATSRIKKYLFGIIAASIAAADILTFSRGGYVGLIAGLAVFLFFFQSSLRQLWTGKKVMAAGILLLSITALLAFPNPVRERLLSSINLEEGSNAGRVETWKESISMIAANPMGVGIGNYAYELKPSADYREPIYSHNLYLDIAAETGIPNALIFIFLLCFSFGSFAKYAKRDSVYLAGAVSLVIFSVHSFFDTPLFSIHVFPLLLILIALSTTTHEDGD